jgi:hypothetical protein
MQLEYPTSPSIELTPSETPKSTNEFGKKIKDNWAKTRFGCCPKLDERTDTNENWVYAGIGVAWIPSRIRVSTGKGADHTHSPFSPRGAPAVAWPRESERAIESCNPAIASICRSCNFLARHRFWASEEVLSFSSTSSSFSHHSFLGAGIYTSGLVIQSGFCRFTSAWVEEPDKMIDFQFFRFA